MLKCAQAIDKAAAVFQKDYRPVLEKQKAARTLGLLILAPHAYSHLHKPIQVLTHTPTNTHTNTHLLNQSIDQSVSQLVSQ